MDVKTMQGLHGFVCTALGIALSVAFPVSHAADLHGPPSTEGTYFREHEPELPREIVLREFNEPGAAYVKLHFNELLLPAGMSIEVSSADRSESYRYSMSHRDGFTFDAESGDDGVNRFWSMSISGDTAIVRLLGDSRRFDPMVHNIEIDRYQAPQHLSTAVRAIDKDVQGDSLETICGDNERYDAVCWEGTHPLEYGRAEPVALLVTGSGTRCTAWRVGKDNHLMTAAHCVSDQATLSSSELWFDYELTNCGGSDTNPVTKVTGNDLLATDSTLDYTLFTVNGFSDIRKFGYLGLDVRAGSKGEEIFIPQHGKGKPKQIALESDMNGSGLCEIDDSSIDGYAKNSDIGYYCDTTSNSSGAPVVSAITGRAIALHHLGGCYNQGTKVSLIWSQVSGFFGNEIPEGDDDRNWSIPNADPMAIPKVDCVDLACSFDAGDSFDPDGEIVGYAWDFGDGSDGSGISAEHNYAETGRYSVKLRVEDDEGTTSSETVSIEVVITNNEPEAKFSTVCIKNACSFDAGRSVDSDGEIVTYDWSLGDGKSASGTEVEYHYGEAGTFIVTLEVTDNESASDAISRMVTITLPDAVPEADFTWSCEDLECAFDASDSADPDGDITDYNWDYGNSSGAQGRQSTVQYDTAGKYAVTLTVTDSTGNTSTAMHEVEVAPATVDPSAAFTFNCNELNCTFDASSSVAGTYAITAYDWVFGDGSRAAGDTASHEFSESGTYTVTLKVSDENGNTSSRSRFVEARSLTVDPTADFTYRCEELTCALDAANSVAGTHDITAYDWTFGDGSTARGTAVSHTFSKPGTYSLRLKVTDQNGATDSRTRYVEVKESREIELAVQAGASSAKKQTAVLTWSGAQSSTVRILRNGEEIAQVENRGKFSHRNLLSDTKTVRYQVCETGTYLCSGEVQFRGKAR